MPVFDWWNPDQFLGTPSQTLDSCQAYCEADGYLYAIFDGVCYCVSDDQNIQGADDFATTIDNTGGVPQCKSSVGSDVGPACRVAATYRPLQTFVLTTWSAGADGLCVTKPAYTGTGIPITQHVNTIEACLQLCQADDSRVYQPGRRLARLPARPTTRASTSQADDSRVYQPVTGTDGGYDCTCYDSTTATAAAAAAAASSSCTATGYYQMTHTAGDYVTTTEYAEAPAVPSSWTKRQVAARAELRDRVRRAQCIDTRYELEACGGCTAGTWIDAAAPVGVDCTVLTGVASGAVTCISGQCIAFARQTGYTLSANGTCA
ncbi:hypothetical protein Q5752_002243 [Cryptotrichosporon argae]